MAKRSVINRCQELGLALETTGSGIAIGQSPEPGASIPSGDICAVAFGRSAPLARGRAAGTEPQPRAAAGSPDAAGTPPPVAGLVQPGERP
jgi:hypothetical protein